MRFWLVSTFYSIYFWGSWLSSLQYIPVLYSWKFFCFPVHGIYFWGYWFSSLQYIFLRFFTDPPVYSIYFWSSLLVPQFTQKYYFPGLTFNRIYLWGSWFQFTVHVYTFEVLSSAHLLLIWIVINLGRDLPNIWLTCIQVGSNCGVPIAGD